MRGGWGVAGKEQKCLCVCVCVFKGDVLHFFIKQNMRIMRFGENKIFEDVKSGTKYKFEEKRGG